MYISGHEIKGKHSTFIFDTDIPSNLDLYGDDPDAPPPDPDNEVTGVEIPSIDINLQNEVIVSMQQTLSPLTEDIYLQVGAVIFGIVQYLIVITLL